MENAAVLTERSDILIITLTATDETTHIVKKGVIDAVGPDGMTINSSRVFSIDEDALNSALKTDPLGSAALDVYEDEPAFDPRFPVIGGTTTCAAWLWHMLGLNHHHSSASMTVSTRLVLLRSVGLSEPME
ncbi:MAG: NAD(P)-dependent oxidoreductase [Roseobacter sp.]